MTAMAPDEEEVTSSYEQSVLASTTATVEAKQRGGHVIDQLAQTSTEIGEVVRPEAVDHGADPVSDIAMSPKSHYSPSDEDVADRQQRQHHQQQPDAAVLVQSPVLLSPLGGGSRKRKSVGMEEECTARDSSSKKVKVAGDDTAGSLPLDRSLLPAEIWHHIFTFVPPRALGKLLQVNKLFNVYLDPSSCLLHSRPAPLSESSVPNLQPDLIWQASRRRFWSKMPTPLKEKTELDMWRLACMKTCQFCGKMQGLSHASSLDRHRPDPGADGVAIIWPFAVSSCGHCLISHSAKEIDLLLSTSIPSLLLPALPFVLITNELHVLSPSALQNSQIPEGVQFSKIFLSQHLDALRTELASVKALGAATTEEWLKGLEDRGKEYRSDAVRWERWAAGGGVVRMQTADGMPTISNSAVDDSSTVVNQASGGTTPKASASLSRKTASDVASPGSIVQPVRLISCENNEPFSRPQTTSEPLQHYPRARTLEQVREMKAARRAEIERRAMLLEPPLPSTVLAHIPSFQAALQIISPLDEAAWYLLKPRLLAQRTDAEMRVQRELEVAAHSRVIQERSEERRNVEDSGRETKELSDKDWDDVQAPLRAQISSFADEIIRDGWKNGDKVTKQNCPSFAVEVLQYVRKRFCAEIAKDDAAARAAGQEVPRDPPEGPFTRKLTLENMKWLFDTKIKPLTESHRKELFLCNGDGCETNPKLYGFEGVIQHFAAKHTTALSQGSVVVYWRSEWPKEPPFHPEPLSRAMTTAALYTKIAGPPPHEYPSQQQQPQHYANTALPGYQNRPYLSQYVSPQLPPVVYGLQGLYASPPTAYNQSYPPPPAGFSAGYNPQGNIPQPTLRPGASTNYNQNYNVYQSNNRIGYSSGHNSSISDKVLAQLDDLARNSREIWQATNGLKGLPGDIRVYVILFHVVNRYRGRFFETPPLTMFIDGLNKNREMRPVRNVNGLMCRACKLRLGNSMPVEEEKETYSLPQLLNHFQHKHIEPFEAAGAPLLDWTRDMVYVPDVSSLSNLRKMVGLDSHKYALIMEAFPQLPGLEAQQYPIRDVPDWLGSKPYLTGGTPANGNDTSIVYETSGNSLPLANSQSAAPGQRSIQTSISSYDQRQASHQKSPQTTIPSAEGSIGREIAASGVVQPQPQSLSCAPQQDSSGRDAPNSRQASVAKNHSRRIDSKDCRAASRHENRPSKSSTRPAQASSDPLHTQRAADDEMKLAEEEEQRQEEAIRAMWAADRREAARMHTVPHAAEIQTRIEYSPISGSSTPSRLCGTLQGGPPLGGRPEPTIAQDREVDLFAGLELLLDQQQASNFNAPSSPGPAGSAAHEQNAIYELRSILEPRRDPQVDADSSDRRGRYDGQHLHEYTQVRYKSPERIYRYSDLNLAAYEQGSAHVRPAPVAQPPPTRDEFAYISRPVYDMPYERRMSQQDDYEGVVAREYERDALRTGSYARYTEAYELIRVRDSQGEYYIRRPVEPDREPVHAEYKDHRQVYRDVPSRDGREREFSYREQPYVRARAVESDYRHPGYEAVARHSIATRQPAQASGAATFEEYDPRHPAGPVSMSGSRPVRYY